MVLPTFADPEVPEDSEASAEPEVLADSEVLAEPDASEEPAAWPGRDVPLPDWL